jgi:hypothetical protein
MSLYERYKHPAPFSDLPLWRRAVFVSGLGIFLLTLVMNLGGDSQISEFRPTDPVAATGQTHRVVVNHGSVRYVTQEEEESLDFWRDGITEWAGPSFMAAFFVWVTFRKPKQLLQ